MLGGAVISDAPDEQRTERKKRAGEQAHGDEDLDEGHAGLPAARPLPGQHCA